MLTQSEINDSIKNIWTKKLQQKEESLTDSILKGYTNWVQNLVKQSAEQQAQQQQQTQPAQQPVSQGKDNLQEGGVA